MVNFHLIFVLIKSLQDIDDLRRVQLVSFIMSNISL